jgi:hypothetical protein
MVAMVLIEIELFPSGAGLYAVFFGKLRQLKNILRSL